MKSGGAGDRGWMKGAVRCVGAGLLAFLMTLAGIEAAGWRSDDAGWQGICASVQDCFVPAPPDCVFRFDAGSRAGAGTALRFYESTASAEEIARFYMIQMPRLGWRFDDAMSRRIGEEIGEDGVFCFASAAAVSIVSISQREDGRRAVWILSSLRGEKPDVAAKGERT